MYQCTQCKKIQESPVMKRDAADGEFYRFCRACGGLVNSPAESCRSCGRELFPEQRAYEIGEEIYCTDCVSEVII